MARPLRLEFPSALFHVTTRGNAKQPIFLDDTDREQFVDLLGRCVTRCHWILPSYSLMPNHVHLVVQLQRETLSRGMQWLNGSYSQAFNRRHQRVGHLLQGRFQAFLIEKETYYLEVLRYVVLNPVRANIVATPEKYRWSSHRAVLGQVEAPEWLAVDDVLAQFAADRQLARDRYRAFVDAGVGLERVLWRDLVAQAYLGTTEWIEGVRAKIALEPRANEHTLAQRTALTWTMADIVAAVATAFAVTKEQVRAGLPRLVAVWIAWNEAGLTLSKIAAGLRIQSTSRVSQLIRECDSHIDANPALQRWIDRSHLLLVEKIAN